MIADIGQDIDFQLTDPKTISLVSQLSYQIKEIDKTLEEEMRSKIAEVMQQEGGFTIENLRDAVKEATDLSLGRSRVIARTEIGQAFNGARYNAMGEAGIMEIEWLSAQDKDVRTSHQIDGETTAVGGARS